LFYGGKGFPILLDIIIDELTNVDVQDDAGLFRLVVLVSNYMLIIDGAAGKNSDR
jgi:hypothetical protein